MRSEPGIDLLTGVPATGLLDDGGRVRGVETGDGTVEAGAVNLAQNGIGANERMVREHLGERVAGALYHGWIAWGTRLGAATEHMGLFTKRGVVGV